MASPAQPIADHQPLPTLTDYLLEDIFLRLPTPTDLARASTACASFHSIITGRSFLRRFRAIHPPPLLGFATEHGFRPAQPPHPSAPLGRALAGAADFSCSFVPAGKWSLRWSTRDVRQGRVLLECVPEHDFYFDFYNAIFPRNVELAVCDPLYRRYVLLPPIPDELAAQHERLTDFGAFLPPTGEYEEETSFRVISTAWNETNLFAFVFSSVTGQWSMAASPSWTSLGTVAPFRRHRVTCFDYAWGCFFFTVLWGDKLLLLDALRMEFSVVDNAPSGYTPHRGQPCIVVNAEGTPLMFILNDHTGDGSVDQLIISKLDDSEASNQ